MRKTGIRVSGTGFAILAMLMMAPSLEGHSQSAEAVNIQVPEPASPRLLFAADWLCREFKRVGWDASVVSRSDVPAERPVVLLGNAAKDHLTATLLKENRLSLPTKPESYLLKSLPRNLTLIAGADDSGVLYGALELAERTAQSRSMPSNLNVADGPEFKLRGSCIGMQKLTGGYLWPYTPENFPFFYDKQQWEKYLDVLLVNRMNSLSLWNGHPFSSLVKLPDYPEALEVPDEILARNQEMFLWLTSECDKRGIWLIQKFYNIHLPVGLAKKYNLETSLSRPTPVATDYTRKAIAKFVELYPNVGLMVCLGEALEMGPVQAEWLTQAIIAGVKDGLQARGEKELPPIVIRGHHLIEGGAHKQVMKAGLQVYPNLLTMAKFNGESLTTWSPRGHYQQWHKELAEQGGVHVVNVHLLANLEPFRYADFDFIWKSVRAIRDRLDGQGLHLYPLSYWGWPDSADKSPLLQIDRDRLWFEIWARYSWKIDRGEKAERKHWIRRLEEIYGDRAAAEKIYQAYNAAGECAPRLLRRFGITGGGRQVFSLGMRLDQMVNAARYHVWEDLRASDSPPGEDLRQYVTREWRKEPHLGETPPQIIEETLTLSAQAVEAIEAAAPRVRRNREEFERLRNDIHCIRELTEHYTATARAALLLIRHEFSQDSQDLAQALPYLESGVAAYRRLNERAGPAYRYTSSFHGRQMIPANGPWHWSQMIDLYQQDLEALRTRVRASVTEAPSQPPADHQQRKRLVSARFRLLTIGAETYTVEKGARVFTDTPDTVEKLAPELEGLTGIRFSQQAASQQSVTLEFEVDEPVLVLVGYFQSKDKKWLQVPALEHVAHADERGGYQVRFPDAATFTGLPPVNVHAFRYEKGRQKVEMIGIGSYIVVGVVPAGTR